MDLPELCVLSPMDGSGASYAGGRSACARSLSQSVIPTTQASTTELTSKILAAVPLKPNSLGKSQEPDAKAPSIIPWVLKGMSGLTPKR